MKILKLLLFFGILSGNVIAQNANETSSISEYINDGGRSKSANILKTDLVMIYQGTVPFIWEHLFSRDFSLEMGAGIVLPYYNRPPVMLENDIGQNSLRTPNLGGSFHLSPKFLTSLSNARGFEAFYASIPLSIRYYTGQLSLFDAAVVFGKQWLFTNNRLVIDISAGFGINCQFSLDKKSYVFNAEDRYTTVIGNVFTDESYPETVHFIIPVSIKIGYRF
ncbi:MAG: hypothetical protein FWD60_12430 [Candidatus Azobacteroides sp.]|nr:hypothetical protein [Candidatus Azobacteroides sp.]